jgi:hypothetical protein
VGGVSIVDKFAERQGNTMLALFPYLLVSLSTLLVGLNGWLTVRDYFGTWAHDDFVRFQYHAPTREVANWLNQQAGVNEVAIGTHPAELVLDPVALKLDLKRPLAASWFDPEAALILPVGQTVIVSAMQQPGDNVREILGALSQPSYQGESFDVFETQALPGDLPPYGAEFAGGGLSLKIVLRSEIQARPGQPVTWRTFWSIDRPVSIPGLKIFLHVLNDQGQVVAGSDRADVNFATTQVGDGLWQINQVTLPADLPPGRYPIEIGWYNSQTGERLKLPAGDDRFLLAPLEVVAP